MEKVIIIGGGASGLACAAMLNGEVTILERGERVGRKLSSTGNGQGNVTNVNLSIENYFSVMGGLDKAEKMLARFGKNETLGFLESLGGVFLPDGRGRVYPSGKQASAVTDLLRFNLSSSGKKVVTGAFVKSVKKRGKAFEILADVGGKEQRFTAEKVVIAAGGKAAKNFGTDGNGYELAKKLGHTVSATYPSLVQLKTDVQHIKTLKGIRVNARVTAYQNDKIIGESVGDIIFADYGVSGDSVFRLSAFITDKAAPVSLKIDLLPDIDEQNLVKILTQKSKNSAIPSGELLCGIVNNQVGRAVLKRVNSIDCEAIALGIKHFTLSVTGNLGYDYAQVTKGGVPMREVTDDLESKKCGGAYFTGEILDVDGECGGYNLQWAFTSAAVVADAINRC